MKTGSDVAKSCCLPPIRWAGGKRLLVDRLRRFVPSSYSVYYEPMVGSGALFFALAPTTAVLGDINPELMNFYRVLRANPTRLYAAISRLRAAKHRYYAIRAKRPRSPLARAARFFYLIRLSWNGLYRVNRNGEFNVPFGGRRPRELSSKVRLLRCGEILQHARLKIGDVERVCEPIRDGDFVFFDPPYPRGAWADNGFARYSKQGFGLDEHKRLARLASELADRGAHVLVTEAARKEFHELYSRSFYMTAIRTPSLIAADDTYRRDAYELIITSYPCVANS